MSEATDRSVQTEDCFTAWQHMIDMRSNHFTAPVDDHALEHCCASSALRAHEIGE